MYVPSDFFVTSFKWVEVFPPHRSLTLERPCAFHVMHKDVDPVLENDAVVDPPDADYLFSAKVIFRDGLVPTLFGSTCVSNPKNCMQAKRNTFIY